jgi:F0F1-type ATP synthase assembly protein I
MKKKNNPDSGSGSKAKENQWMEFLHLGWIFAITLTLTLGAGIWIDQYFGTRPIFLLGGTLIGFAGCGYSLYRIILKVERSESSRSL